jgi:hypothetical protein
VNKRYSFLDAQGNLHEIWGSGETYLEGITMIDDPMPFITKDSGERQEFSTGMRRDVQKGKPRYDLIWQPGLKRVAELMGRGAEKYSERNWEKAATQEELERFKASAYRHFCQWFTGETDEDHMAGTIFNLFGAEYVKERLKGV